MTEAPAEPPVRLGPAAANVARSIWHQKELLVLGLVLGLGLGWFVLPKVLSSGSTYDATVRLQVLQPPADAILKIPPAVGQAPSDDSSGASPDVLKDVVVADRVVDYLKKTKRLGPGNDLTGPGLLNRLTITPLERSDWRHVPPTEVRFELKEPLGETRYNQLWRRIEETKRRSGLVS